MKDATDVVHGYSDEVKGTIKVTMPVVSSNLVLSKAIAEFCHNYPNVNVEVNVNNRCVDIIAEGYDLAIRTANLADSGLVARRLVDSQWVVCATPEYLQNNGEPEHPNDLHEHQCLIYTYEGSGTDNWLFSVNGIEQQIQIRGRFNTNNLDSLRQAALSNLGITMLPQALVYDDLQRGALKPVLSKYANKTLGIYAVYPNSRQPDQKLKLLIEHFRDSFQKHQHQFCNQH